MLTLSPATLLPSGNSLSVFLTCANIIGYTRSQIKAVTHNATANGDMKYLSKSAFLVPVRGFSRLTHEPLSNGTISKHNSYIIRLLNPAFSKP